MPRGVYVRKDPKTKGSYKLVKPARRKKATGVVDTIPTITKSQLIRSSIYPRSSSTTAERTIEVERGTTLIIKVI